MNDKTAVLLAENAKLQQTLELQQACIQQQDARIQEQHTRLQQQDEYIQTLTLMVEQMREEIRILRLREFGRKSEKIKSDEKYPMLFDEQELLQGESIACETPEETVVVHVPEQTYTRKKRGRKAIDNSVQRVTLEYTITEEQRNEYKDYTITELGKDKSERLHEIPAQYYVIERIIHKYKAERVSTDGSTEVKFFSASIPQAFLPRSIATSGLLSHVITGKFCDGLPLQRQEAIFARHGIVLSKQTMANWCIESAKQLAPLMNRLEKHLLQSPAINCDETPFVVMQEPGKENSSKSYMVVLAGGGTDPQRPRIVLFRYSAHRSAACIDAILKEYKGALQSDAYKGYTNFSARNEQIHAGCWAHARRKFREVWEAAGKQGKAGEMIGFIRLLYDGEAMLRQKYKCKDDPSWDTVGFLKERKDRIMPIFAKMRTWLENTYRETPPKSGLGMAVQYTQNEWERLIAYIESPWFTPDNNVVERAIKPFTVGRKNWVISGSPRGAYASAMLYSFIETAKSNGVDPYYYLRWLFDKLPITQESELDSLLPWNIDIGDIAVHFAKEDAQISLKAKQQNQTRI